MSWQSLPVEIQEIILRLATFPRREGHLWLHQCPCQKEYLHPSPHSLSQCHECRMNSLRPRMKMPEGYVQAKQTIVSEIEAARGEEPDENPVSSRSPGNISASPE